MRRTIPGLIAVISLLFATVLVTTPGSAAGGSVMDGHPMGVETLPDEGNALYNDYVNAKSETKRELLRRSAMQPRVRWYGRWTGTGAQLRGRISNYIANVQDGDPDKVVAMATFRVKSGNTNMRPLTTADKKSYRVWYTNLAKAIGTARVIVVLEPDLPLTLPRHRGQNTKGRLALVSGAVAKLEALPNTDVYIDAGSADWLTVKESVWLLTRAGVAQARGFALGATHYDSTADNIDYSRRLSQALAKAGIPGKRSVIDTADNGRPFTWLQYRKLQRDGKRKQHFDNADPCVNLRQTKCDTLGIPPTTDVANPRWGHSDAINEMARDYVDAYIWFGRPWLRMQASPYCRVRAMQVGRTTPWAPAVPQLAKATVKKAQAKCFVRP